ncbi:MAG: sodium-dependent transporter [Lachnospirales bacterium]
MSKNNSTHEKFSSRIAIIAATAGGAVGLGNLWSFPYKAGVNGGGTFVVMYLISVLLIGAPVMLAEFIIGRAGHGGPMAAISNLDNKKSPFMAASWLATFTAFSIMSFYCVIAGWAVIYFIKGIKNGFSSFLSNNSAELFNQTISNTPVSTIGQLIFIGLTVAVVLLGIEKGIEKLTKVMMPLLFIIIVLMVVYSMTLSGFNDALRYLFTPTAVPDKNILEISLAAMGQSFFSLSVGMGVSMTYARYIDKKEDLGKITLQVAVADTTIALLAGLAIFPIIFTTPGIEPTGGAGLAFISLPVGFAQMPFGRFIGISFFFLLIVAAVTSSVALLECVVVAVMEKTKIKRTNATISVAVLAAALGVLCQKGLNFSLPLLTSIVGTDTSGAPYAFLEQLDKLTMEWTIPIAALVFTIFTGWRLKPEILKEQISNKTLAKVFSIYIKYVSPILILILFAGVFFGIVD